MQPREQDDTGVDVGSNETAPARTSADPGRPGRGRLRPLAAGLAAFAALLALPLQAEAQKTTFVSNTGQSTDPDVREVGPHGHLWQLQAQQFRTGDNEGGYTLSAIQVRVDDFGSNSRPKVSIYTTSSGNPGTSLYVLTNPATLNDDAINTFGAPANATLEKDTNYFVVFEELGSGSNLRYDLEVTTSIAEDSGKASGWNIANSSRQRSTTATSWDNLAGKLKIAVRGTLPPAISIEDASAAENAGYLLFDVTLSRASPHTVKVDFETISGGTATEGVDYHARRTYTHVILAGDKTAQMGFALIEDTVAAAGETVMVRLSNARVVDAYGDKIKDLDITRAEATGTINAPTTTTTNVPNLTIGIEDVTGDEDDGWLVFKVRLSQKYDEYVCYDFETISGGTAMEGTDYSKRPKVRQWVQIGKRVDKPFVRIIDDLVNDNGETVKVKISNARLCDDASQTVSITRAEATGTIRNSDPLSNSPVAGPDEDPAVTNTGAPTISGTAQVDETLTASVSGISDADGLDDASFAYQWIRGSADIEGATDSSYTLVSADEGETIKVRVSFTDDAENAESLTSAATDAVAAAPKPLTASFSGMPSEHAGEGETFTFGLTFSEEFGLSYKTLRDEAFDVRGGEVRRAEREQQGSNQSWTIHVEPSGHGPVTVTLPETTDCGATGAICTDDDRPLSHSLLATVAGPVGISVGDARVEEDDGAVLSFAVTLSRAASGALTVDYATSDGSAQAGVDYTAASGTLTFQAGESSWTIEVLVIDDVHDEGEETLTLTLSNASNGRLTDAEATGTIENRDPLPRALLARFGRTAAVHVVEHVEERIEAPREPGFRGRFAGRELRRGMERELALSFLSQFGGSAGANGYGVGGHDPMAGSPGAGFAGMGSLRTPGLARGGVGMPGAAGTVDAGARMRGAGTGAVGGAGMMGGAPGPMSAAAGPDGGLFGGGLHSMGLGGDNLLTGSAFAMNRESHGGILSFWSRGAQSYFAGREGTLGLSGDVRTMMFGADYAKGPLVAGLSLSHSRGLGEYAGVAAGQVASAVTGLYPWLGYKATDRVTVWGVAGYGRGGLLLTPDNGPALESGLSMAMAAAGTRGELIAGGAGGFALAFKADALWVGTAIDGVDGAAGRLAATEAAVTRFRTGLEGSRAYTLAGRLSLRPSVEVGLRHDGGDAETGAGMDVGAGLIVSDAGSGLAVDVRVRTLLVHQAEGFRERGMALSLSYNPTPSTPLGLTAKVAPSWGGQATSGAEALWGRETMAGMAQAGVASGSRLDAEVGYGLPVGSRFVGTPRVGVGTSEMGRDYRLGYSLGVLNRESLAFELGVEAHRRESPMLGTADNGFLGRATVGW